MKTTIWIPDAVFQAAEEAARRLSISRSRLYTRAVEEFLQRQAPANVTQRLDEVYSENSSCLDPNLMRLQSLSLTRGVW